MEAAGSSIMAGFWLVAAATLFWLSWIFMPGVGVTDPHQIFELVARQRPLVAASVVMQLASAVCYVPAMIGMLADPRLARGRAFRWAAGLMLAGAMGSAADAVLHLLAYAMTYPGLERPALVPVMSFMQGPGLVLLAPLIVSFFAGGAVLSFALAKIKAVSPWNAGLHLVGVAVAVGGGMLAGSSLVAPRAVGLTFLGLVSAAQAWAGVALWRRRRRSAPAYSRATLEPSGYPSPRMY
jgi:hypothetical protein